MLKDKSGKALSRSEGEAIMKSRSSIAISICAALLALAAMTSNSNSSRILNDTLSANDTWAFFQAKSIKLEIAQANVNILESDLASIPNTTDTLRQRNLIEFKITKEKANISRYESDPVTHEGKIELAEKARAFEKDREIAKKRSAWFGMASASLQIAIVLASSSILAVSMPMLIAGGTIGFIGALLLANAVFSVIPTLPF